MELLNATKMTAAYTQGMDKTGRESLVVVVKGTFSLPLDGSSPKLVQQQLPLVEADQFSGEPGFSAVLYESEFAPVKHRCDVLLNGSAYSPKEATGERRPTALIEVAIKVSSITKAFNVTGDRYWFADAMGIGVGKALAFTQMPITYDVAFGGVDNFHRDEARRDAYMDNPIGKGFHRYLTSELVHNTPLPNTEERGKKVTGPSGNYRPMALGPVGRSWPERAKFAGTYDQQWVDNVFPFLPADFDDRYYQSAPVDQQCDYLVGGELVQLLNLTETGRTAFRIPTLDVPVIFFRKKAEDVRKQALADTLIIEPDKGIFSMLWRCSEPLKKNLFEIPQVLVGNKSRAWWRARELGKTYYPSLAHVVANREDNN